MTPFRFWVLVCALTACSAQTSPGPVSAPAPESSRAAAPDAPDSAVQSASASGVIAPAPPAPVAPGAIPLVDTTDADLDREAADSAADAAILEQLAESAPESEDSGADPLTGGTNEVARDVTWDIDVETYNSHTRVKHYLDFFQGPARERFGIWLTRLPRYESMIRTRLREEGLPEDMVYLALIESGFSNTAVSRSRAVGMWQFMKGTAKLYGLRIDTWVDERRDPFKATSAAVRHLADLRTRFGSLYLAAAAYNAGAGRVGRGLKRLPEEEEDTLNADALFFRLYDTKYLRRETKDYVPKLIAAALIAKEPEKYGFSIPPGVQPIELDSIVVTDATGLDVIARLADTTLAAVREWNPQYLRMVTPPRTRSVIRLAKGRGESVAEAYTALPAKERVSFLEHKVARGETLGGIARRYHVSTRMITDANPKIRPRALRVGQWLVIPTSGYVPSREVLRSTEDPGSASRAKGGVYTVRAGESLWTLSRKFSVTVEQLREWNGLSDQHVLKAGQRLRVSAPRSGSASTRVASASAPKSTRTHVVKRGETLSGIADNYRVSLSSLLQVNHMTSRSTLRAGSRIKIPG